MRNRSRNKRKSINIVKMFMIIIISILGVLTIRTIYQNRFEQVDIVLDAGHGGKDPGAMCEDVSEKEILYQQKIAAGISDGIIRYISSIK